MGFSLGGPDLELRLDNKTNVTLLILSVYGWSDDTMMMVSDVCLTIFAREPRLMSRF